MDNTARNVLLDEDYEYEEEGYENFKVIETENEELENGEPKDEKPAKKGLYVKHRKSMRIDQKKSDLADKAKEKKNGEDYKAVENRTSKYKECPWKKGHHILLEE